MHSAASSASLYMAVLMDLSPEQIAEAQKMDFAVATFRSAAGVHGNRRTLFRVSVTGTPGATSTSPAPAEDEAGSGTAGGSFGVSVRRRGGAT